VAIANRVEARAASKFGVQFWSFEGDSSMQGVVAALVALEDTLDLDTLRQCLCLYDHNKPDCNTLDVYTLLGKVSW
jgi:hypothetical protein